MWPFAVVGCAKHTNLRRGRQRHRAVSEFERITLFLVLEWQVFAAPLSHCLHRPSVPSASIRRAMKTNQEKSYTKVEAFNYRQHQVSTTVRFSHFAKQKSNQSRNGMLCERLCRQPCELSPADTKAPVGTFGQCRGEGHRRQQTTM